MTKYEITGVYANFNSGSGMLELTDEQAAARSHALKKVNKKGRAIKTMEGFALYEIIQPTGFKHGEVVGFSGDVNKLLMADIEDIEEKKKARAKEEEEAEREKTQSAELLAKKNELDSRSTDHGNDGGEEEKAEATAGGAGTGDADDGTEEIELSSGTNATKIPGAFFVLKPQKKDKERMHDGG